MAREHSLENPMQIMPEHVGWCGKGLALSVKEACDKFLREREPRWMGMREIVHEGAKEGEARKARRMKRKD